MTKALKETMLFFGIAVLVIIAMILFPEIVLGLPRLLAPKFL